MVSLKVNASIPDCMILDYDSCIKVVKSLEELSDSLNLQEKVPEVEHSRKFNGDTKNHLIFLILATSQDAGKQSHSVYRGGLRMLLDIPYDSLAAKRDNESEIERIAIKYFQMSKYGNVGKILLSGINFIENFCEGDPTNLYAGTQDPEVVRKRLLQVHGIGRNISSLLLKNLVRFGYFVPEDRFDIPIKMDRHALSISVANGVIQFISPSPEKGVYRGKLEKCLEVAYRKACKEYRIDPIKVDDAKWALGSELSRNKNSIIRAFSGLHFNFPVRYAQFADGSTNLNYFLGG